MDKYGVNSTHNTIKNKLLDYINTEYLGKCDVLRKACKSELQSKGVLFQDPYIEANSSYLTVENGLASADLEQDVKIILFAMIDAGLGVFRNPYKHQIESLEQYYHGKDLFVATGTGSGKTECFMWPMVSRLVLEQMKSPKTWEVRGVRAILMYPMNALVSDQLGRLRRMIGNQDNGFHNLISKLAPGCRVPQFGMYTGRTPYAGEPDKKQNSELADTIEKDILQQSDEVKTKLCELGKYPSKKDLSAFVERLRNNEKVLTDPQDSELITRYEMQENCPDILITNYSMLEYMLMRPIEKTIWNRTKEWLDSNSNNKLMFIIDEAHMYRGSAGGEVALLIRRVLHKLGIERNRVQFILTSASVPSGIEKEKAVYQFACDLSAQSNHTNTFKLIRGKKETININGKEFNPESLLDYDIDTLQQEWKGKSEAIKEFSRRVGFDLLCDFSNEKSVENYLYNELQKCNPMLRIMKQTRGYATSFKKLAQIAFPKYSQKTAEKATSALLAVAPLARNNVGNVLYPARLHMMFRGLHGIYACSNPHCTCNNHHSNELQLGHIYLNKPSVRCKCGGMIYELVNERSCGGIFLKGYLDSSERINPFVWNEPGIQFTINMKEVHFYIIPNDGSYQRSGKEKIAWLNSMTGRLYEFGSYEDEKEVVQVAYCDEEIKGKPNIWTFKTCPKCDKQRFLATDFHTKGNEPFFNIVSEQFYVQPPVPKYKNLINEGRKVLLFSDSRQRAAVLARDLTRAADENAMRKALIVAAAELQEWAQRENKTPTLNLMYVKFLEVAYKNNLRFFYGNNEEKLLEAVKLMGEQYEKKQGKIKYNLAAKRSFKTVPNQYYEHLLIQMCSSFRSLTDIGLCWLEPSDIDEIFEEIQDSFDDADINMSIDEFKILFSAWAKIIFIILLFAKMKNNEK